MVTLVHVPENSELHLYATTLTGTAFFAVVPDSQTPALPSLTSVWPECLYSERYLADLFNVTWDNDESNVPFILHGEQREKLVGMMRRDVALAARHEIPWPGLKDPADTSTSPSRRKSLPAGVHSDWEGRML